MISLRHVTINFAWIRETLIVLHSLGKRAHAEIVCQFDLGLVTIWVSPRETPMLATNNFVNLEFLDG